MFCLRNILPDRNITAWSFFIKACMMLCKRSIAVAEISQGHELLTMYCKQFKILYDTNNYVLNMHLPLHLKECIKDFGPVYGFWCFSFERYNGIMGNYHTNNQSIEIQVMRKFVTTYILLKSVCEKSTISQLGTFKSDSLLYKIRNVSNLNGSQLEFLC